MRNRYHSSKSKHVSPHVLPHSTATDLLQRGIDRSVIALWLGHESAETTQIYLDTNLELKEKVLTKTRPFDVRAGSYRPDDHVLAFLRTPGTRLVPGVASTIPATPTRRSCCAKASPWNMFRRNSARQDRHHDPLLRALQARAESALRARFRRPDQGVLVAGTDAHNSQPGGPGVSEFQHATTAKPPQNHRRIPMWISN